MASTANENFSAKVIKEIARELKSLDDSPPEGIRVIVYEENISTIHAEIDGPVGTPYEGGLFRMKLVLGQDFPQAPPKGYFLTRIFHPNIAKSGDICVNTLKKDWKPTLGVRHVLVVVRCLLIEPYPESALNEEAGKILMEDYDSYARHARLMTSIHALKPRARGIGGEHALSVTSSAHSTPLALNSSIVNSDRRNGTADGSTGDHGAGGVVGAKGTSENVNSGKVEMDVKLTAEKRKVDSRKKNLRRL